MWIRFFTDWVLRHKVPLSFRLQAGHWLISFTRPHLGSRPKILDATLEPCLGLSLGVGLISGQIVPQEHAGLVSGTEMGSGCALSVLMGSAPPVTGSTSSVASKADAIPISDPGLPMVTIAKVTTRTMNVYATPVTILMISEWAEADAMPLSNPGLPVDTVAEVWWLLRLPLKLMVRLIENLLQRKACSRGFSRFESHSFSFGSTCQRTGYPSLLYGWFWCFFLWGG
jgi:hypothetical protein